MPTLRNDRDAPYHFAGRTKEIGWLKDRLSVLAETEISRGGIALITGVPGSGKTTLANVFAETCYAVHFKAGVYNFDDPVDAFLSIGKAIDRESYFARIAGVDSRFTAAGTSGSIAGVASGKINLTREHVRPVRGFAAMLQLTKDKWTRPLVVVVDELQNLNAKQAETLRVLHEGGHECPILVVGAGLQNTHDVLSRNGISRVDEGIALGTLDRQATIEVISETLADFNLEASPEVVERFAEASHDFPQHINCYITAATKAAKDGRGWFDRETTQNALDEGDRLRTRYYDRRLMAMGRGRSRMIPVIARMMKTATDSLDMQESIDAIDDAKGDGEKTVDDAVHHGVLTLGLDERVSFGIPSFRNHMLDILREHELQHELPKRDGVIR